MNEYLISLIMSVLVGAVGTGLGGVISLLFKKKSNDAAGVMLGLSAGVMLAVVFVSMVPEVVALSGWISLFAAMIIGAAFMVFLHWLLPHTDAPTSTPEHASTHEKSSKLVSVGILLGIGIAIHNLPEGLALGASVETLPKFSFALGTLLLLHNIPEGMAMAIPMRLGGMSGKRAVFLTFAAGLPTVVGALIGTAIGKISTEFLSGAIAFAAGAMLYLTVRELIPETLMLGKKKTAIFAIFCGFAVGAGISLLANM